MTELKTIKDRLLFFVDSLDMTRAEFERRAGLSNGYLKNFKGNIGPQKLEGLLNAFPELSRVWLLTGEGGMVNSNYPDPEPLEEFEKHSNPERPDANIYESLYNKEVKEKEKLYSLLEAQQKLTTELGSQLRAIRVELAAQRSKLDALTEGGFRNVAQGPAPAASFPSPVLSDADSLA